MTTAIPDPKARASHRWNSVVFLLLLLVTVEPLSYGIPLCSSGGGTDANFALTALKGYAVALHAGTFFPRWLPDGNFGLGSPVFYYYGRLPFLFAALLADLLHASASAALLCGMACFRLLAFFTCRAWLRR